MKAFKVMVLFVGLAGCGDRNTVHKQTKITSQWRVDNSEAHSCSLFTGRAALVGSPASSDPQEMVCGKAKVTFNTSRDVLLNPEAEQAFGNEEKWIIPLLCTRIAPQRFSCVLNK